MDERREARRIEVNHPIVAQIDGEQYDCELVNLSAVGALLSMGTSGAESGRRSQEDLSTNALGSDASFVIRPKGRARRSYTGEIIRIFYESGKQQVALRFWHGYTELAD